MNRSSIIACASVAAALLRHATPVAGQATPEVTEFTVAGIHVIHKPLTANDVIAARLFLRGGATAITRDNAGIENVIARAMTQGTVKYSKDAFSEQATATGTVISGTATVDYTSFGMQAVRQHFTEAWDLFTQAALHPTFPDVAVRQVKEQITNELKQRTDHPDSYLRLVADSLLYEGHPYAADVQGSGPAIAKLTREDLARWHRQRMTKNNLLLVVVGNVTRAELEPRIASAFGGLSATGTTRSTVPPIAEHKSTIAVVERSLPTNYIIGLFPAPGRASPDYPAMQLATQVLSQRLFEEVRTKRNLTYAVQASISGAQKAKGSLYVTAVQPDTTMKVIFHEVRRLQREPVLRTVLQQTANVFRTSLWMGQETNMGQATSLGMWELTGGGWRNARAFVDQLRSVTPAEIQRVATRYYTNARWVVIGDPSKITRQLFIDF